MKTYSPKQSSLFDTAVARKNDPVTSHAAADAVNETNMLSQHHQVILEVLRHSGESLTPREIADRCYLTYYQVQRRMKELEGKGLVGWDGKRDGQRVWRLIK